ncbi:MAG: tail fiber protein [Caldilineales bacterium]|nr:tail fiber protein [Caldilineales bacterium]MCW5860170.1 tail fiber protein [Caldilineales bacterium]
MEPYVAEIRMFAGNFAPRGWALCEGQVLSIAQNTALFSLLGTNYGGDGKSTFALPDLRGRMPVQEDPSTWPYLGELGDGVDVAASKSGYVGINYIIALQGEFPPRS